MIDYSQVEKTITNVETGIYDISIIVPVRGRVEFHKPLVDALQAAIDKTHLRCCITFVEHSVSPLHLGLSDVNHIHIPTTGAFNKSLCFNMGFIYGVKAEMYLLHDLDCVMNDDFIDKLIVNLSDNILQAKAVQSFAKRRVLYCDRGVTNKLTSGLMPANMLKPNMIGISAPDKHLWAAPGGSIFCTRSHFIDVGGFDPDMYWGYAPEDAMFYDKLSLTGGIGSCDNIELYHMWHEPLHNSNPDRDKLEKTYATWQAKPLEHKMEIINRRSEHLKKYL